MVVELQSPSATHICVAREVLPRFAAVCRLVQQCVLRSIDRSIRCLYHAQALRMSLRIERQPDFVDGHLLELPIVAVQDIVVRLHLRQFRWLNGHSAHIVR